MEEQKKESWVKLVIAFFIGAALGALLTTYLCAPVDSTSAGVNEKLADVEQALVELQEQRSAAPPSPTTTICNRSITMQEELLSHFNVPLCRYVTSGELYRLESLSVQAYNHRLRPNDFADMVNLSALRIYRSTDSGQTASGNDLLSDFFEHLGGLRHLEIENYSLDSVLDRDWAKELPKLETLVIRDSYSNPSYPRRATIWFSNAGACLHHPGTSTLWTSHENWTDGTWTSGEVTAFQKPIEAAFGPLASCTGRADVGTPRPTQTPQPLPTPQPPQN